MIFHDKPDQQLCDDDKLFAVLNDGDQATDHQDVVEHIEQCPRCQQRFDELAAGAQDWTKARQALLNDDPCSENRVGSAKWDYSLRNEGPVAWTESMASQLLSPASHPELLGRLGRYDVGRLIGSGGMGVVFKAHDSELNRPVAMKILAPYLSSSGPARKRFAREARAAAAVVHEHVVPIYNVETEREIPFLVMHYVAGESLQERVDREGALELCEILRIGMQVASGLSAAHQQGLVHRDIKPSNILMEQGVERALITDFGLARAADDASLTRTGFHPGTPQYMSPEQAAGEQVDARSDLFSLGSVLYTICTGRPPFRAETSLGVLRRITDVEPRPIREINPNIPEWLCSLVARLMSKSPEDRFANAMEVAELLGQCLAHVQQPASMPLPEAVAPIAPIRARRPPIGKFIAAAAFAFALVFAGVFIVRESNKGTLTIQSDADDIRVRITQGDEVIDELKVTKSGQSVRVAAGQYKVEVIGETDDLIVDNEQVTLHRSGSEVVRIVHKTNGSSENQTTAKQLNAHEWQGKLQGSWTVVQQYVDNGVRKRNSYFATVRRNRMELISTDGQDSMMFDLVLGEAGPPQQIDLKPVMSDLERQQLLQGWSDNDEPPPDELVNPIFYGIIELDSHGFRICNHVNPCSPRPIQFTDSSERVIWSFSKSELDESAATPAPLRSSVTTTERTFWGKLFGKAAESLQFNGPPTTNNVEVTPAPVISNVTIVDKTATVSGTGGNDMDCVLRIGKSKKNEQLEWATPVTGKFTATITASDQIASDDGQVMKGIVFTIQNEKVLGTSNIAMSDGDPVPAGEVRFRQLSAMDRADTSWTFADIHCDDGTTIPISILLRANKPLLPAGPLVYKGKVQEWVGEDRDGEPGRVFEDNYKPVPNATLQLYKVSPIVKGGAGYQFEEIAVFKTDKAGYYNVNIPDDLKRFIPTPHTKEWDDWDSLLLVTTSAPGFATNSMTLAANYNIPSIELARGTSINGRLVNENGKPVVGARVTVNEQSRSREREMNGWLGQTSSKPLQADKFDATDADAMLAARTRVSIANHSVGWIPSMIEGVMTDSDGRFTIDGIGTNDLLDLKVEATGYKDSSIKVIGREIKTAYSRDPFASGENIAVYGRNFQVTLVASDRNTIHNRHRVLKDQQVNRNPVSTAEKEMFDAIDNLSPGQRKVIDGKQPDWLGDLQGDWIIESVYIDEDSNSREWQKQAGGPVFIGAIKVTGNELYFRKLPSARMTRTNAAIALEPVEGNDPRLFHVVDSQENLRFGMYKVDGDKLTILLTQEAQPKLLAPTEGEYYIECHRPVSTEEKAVLYAIDKLNPDQIKVIDRKSQDAEQSVPAQGDATTTGNVSGTEKPSPTQAPDTSNGESMDLFQEVAPPSTPDATSKLDFFTEGFHKLVITGNTSRSEYMHLKIGDEPDAQEWILGLGGRFIATFEYSDELSVKGGKKANGLRIGVKHGNGNVSRLQIEMTPVDSVSASSFRFREGALGKPLVDAAIIHDEGRYRIGDVETIDGKKLPVFVQLKDVTSAAGPNSSPSK